MRTNNENETRVVLRRSSYTPTGYAEYSAQDVRCDHGVPLADLCYQCEPDVYTEHYNVRITKWCETTAQQKMVRAPSGANLRSM